MPAEIINGSEIAKQKNIVTAAKIKQRTEQGYRPPGLAVILVGDDKASHSYVRYKKRACKEAGINTFNHELKTIDKKDLLALISNLNANPEVDGILVQLPLPGYSAEDVADIMSAVDPSKDVDGFHPNNIGLLSQGRAHFFSCTAKGVMALLEHTGIKLAGKKVLVVGRSMITGLPIALGLMSAEAAVTSCDKSFSREDLQHAVEQAEVLITTTPVADLIPGEWVKEGSIVIDVGTTHVEGRGLVGNVQFAKAKERAAWITPVPGCVGPMTIASLLENTLQANIEHQLDLQVAQVNKAVLRVFERERSASPSNKRTKMEQTQESPGLRLGLQ